MDILTALTFTNQLDSPRKNNGNLNQNVFISLKCTKSYFEPKHFFWTKTSLIFTCKFTFDACEEQKNKQSGIVVYMNLC